MKVLHINCNYIGSALHQTMIEHLDKQGVENKIFVPTYDSSISIIVPNENVCVAECFHQIDRVVFDYKQQKIFKRIQQEYDIKKFDCIHAYTLFTDGNCAMRLSYAYGIPYVVAVRNTDIFDFLRIRPYLRNRALRIMKGASAVFFLSQAYKTFVYEKYIPEYMKTELDIKSFIIPNGIDQYWHDNAYCRENSDADLIKRKEIKIVFAGRINRNKNICTIQKALCILRNKGWKTNFTIAGKVDDKNEFRKIMNYPNTKYVGNLDREELIKVYRESDVFVMVSYTESFGLVYAEAMSQGLPVVYSKGQGFDGQFPEGIVGFSADSGSPKDVADAIEKTVLDYVSISANAFEMFRIFSWSEITKKYAEIYSSV